jgi:capsular polysaccharide biosynthesis protein
MKANLQALFGEIPANSDNLEIIGTFERRFEEQDWATVWPASGVIRWADGSIEPETLWIKVSAEARRRWVKNQLAQCGDFQSKWSWWPRKRRGRFFNLSLFWSTGYYHWICDVLPRLHNVLSRLTPDIQVILPPGMATWQKRSLELIGLPQNQWLSYADRRPWKVEHLLFASPVAMTGDLEENSIKWVRDTIWQCALGGIPARAGWKRLYLTRKNTWSRNLVNEVELLPLLLERGFEIIDCGGLNFDEQVQLFSEAACVVGPHGAAFTNILWSLPGVKVFEIFEPTAVRRCYWSLSKVLGHHHTCGIGQAVAQPQREPNIKVPMAELIEGLDQFLAKTDL